MILYCPVRNYKLRILFFDVVIRLVGQLASFVTITLNKSINLLNLWDRGHVNYQSTGSDPLPRPDSHLLSLGGTPAAKNCLASVSSTVSYPTSILARETESIRAVPSPLSCDRWFRESS